MCSFMASAGPRIGYSRKGKEPAGCQSYTPRAAYLNEQTQEWLGHLRFQFPGVAGAQELG
jgi:hypothetical protein